MINLITYRLIILTKFDICELPLFRDAERFIDFYSYVFKCKSDISALLKIFLQTTFGKAMIPIKLSN